MKFQTNAMKVKCLAQCFCCCFVLLTCIEPSRQIVKEIFCCRHDFVKGGFLFVCARDGFDRSIDVSFTARYRLDSIRIEKQIDRSEIQ